MINGEQGLPGSANPGLDVRLREVEQQDLEHFFRFQLDPEAILMAAFTSQDPTDGGYLMRIGEGFLGKRHCHPGAGNLFRDDPGAPVVYPGCRTTWDRSVFWKGMGSGESE